MIDDRTVSTREALGNAWRLIRETLPQRWKLFVLSLVCMAGVALFTALLANVTKAIVDDVFGAGGQAAAVHVAMTVIGIAAAKSLFAYVNSLIAFLFNRSIAIDYQKRLFGHVLSQDIPFFAGQHAPRQMAILQSIGRATGRTVSLVGNRLIVEVLTLVSLFWVMIAQDPLMTLLCGVIVPLIFGIVAHISKRIRKASKEELKLSGKYYEKGAEIFEGVKTVKSFQLEEKSIARFNTALDQMEERVLAVARISAATVPLMELLGGLVIGLFVFYGAQQAMSGAMTAGEITAFITAFLMAYQPAERLSKLWVELQQNSVLVTQMYTILDRPAAHLRFGKASLPEAVTPEIAVRDVTFSYGEDAVAVHGLSLTIAPGERIAVVGRSGAGKSTFIDLLQRFYDADTGAITLDGIDIRDLSEDALHRSIAFVSQEIFLFEGTVAENIADGCPGLDRDGIAEAARLARLDDVLATREAGLDMPIGPNGNALSGGQRQRLGIARGLAKWAGIYIFDEVTSALDSHNEREIMATLGEALAGRTQIFVTHRASTFAYVDRVLMLENGRIAGFDTPDALLRDNAAFQALFAEFEVTPEHGSGEDSGSGSGDGSGNGAASEVRHG